MKKIYILLFCVTAVYANITNAQVTSAWTQLTSGTTTSLYGVYAPNDNTCYACGVSGAILKTINGGTSWTQQVSNTNQSLYSIFFTDANTGYAVGNGGVAVKTINGGTTWTSMNLGGITNPFRHVQFIDVNTGYIMGGTGNAGIILKTINAGQTWTTLPITAGGLYSISFTSPLIGYVGDFNGKVYKTTNGGTSWSTGVVTGSGSGSGMLQFFNLTTGLYLNQFGGIRKTTDAGITWNLIPSGTTNSLSGIDIYTANDAFIVGGDNSANTGIILKTFDGGSTWSSYTPGCAFLARVDMINANTGYAVGNNGTILKYTSNVGILENEYSTFKSYPNPFTTSTTIDIKTTQLLPATVCISVYDITGKLVQTSTLEVNGNSVIFERKQLVAGIYFYKLSDNNKIIGNGKFVIQ